MPTGKTPKYCWDSCVFISLLTGADRTEAELKQLRALEKLCDDGGCNILTASITLVEVLACKMEPEQEDMFQALLSRSNVTAVSVTPRIAAKAREIRNHYQSRNLKIAVPDSIHLATAIHYEVTALHTYDGSGPRQRPTDLLRLSMPLIGKYMLTIETPQPSPPVVETSVAPLMAELPWEDPIDEHRKAEEVY